MTPIPLPIAIVGCLDSFKREDWLYQSTLWHWHKY